jgi:hypothetical protein
VDRGGERLSAGELSGGWIRVADGRGGTFLALSVVVALLMGFEFSLVPLSSGLDPSYVYALNYAAAHHLQWGRDFIATYGPYGYLLETMDLATLARIRMAFGLLSAVGFGIAVAVYLRSVADLTPGMRLAAMVAITYTFTIQDPEYRLLILFLVVLLRGTLGDDVPGLGALAFASALAGFCLLVKFSLGFMALASLFIGCCLVRQALGVALRLAVAALAAAGSFLAGWMLAGRGLSGIGAYIATGWGMSQGYSSAMSFSTDRWWIDAGIFLAWFALLALWIIWWPTARNRLALAGLALPLFAAWKHSIVRQDEHVAILARFGLFVMVIVLVESVQAWRSRYAVPAAAALAVLVVIPWMTLSLPAYSVTAGEMVVNPLAFRGVRDLVRLAGLGAYRDTVGRASQAALAERALPEAMRRSIGGKPVDVYPWEASYVAANGLTWANRPLPASFNGFTPALDGRNAAFFRGSGRPEYVLWHAAFRGGMGSIDGRHLLWDEPQTVRAIVDQYDVAETGPDVLLLRARSQPRFGRPEPIGTARVPWATWITVPETRGVLLAAPELQPSLVSRVVRAAFREDRLALFVQFSSGEVAGFRLVPDGMTGGLWLSPLATTFDEVPALFGDGVGRKVIAIQFNGDAMVRRAYPFVTVTFARMLPLTAPEPATPPRSIGGSGAARNGPA